MPPSTIHTFRTLLEVFMFTVISMTGFQQIRVLSSYGAAFQWTVRKLRCDVLLTNAKRLRVLYRKTS